MGTFNMISLLYGSITHHFIGSNLPYCNRINSNGSIHNEYVIAMVGDANTKVGILKGKDSACGNIMGPVSSFKMSDNFEFILGGYNTNFKKFNELGMRPPTIGGITPIVGLDYRLPIYNGDKFKITLDNLVSIGIITHSLRVDF